MNQLKIGDYVKGVSRRTGKIIRGKVVSIGRDVLDIVDTNETLYVLMHQHFHIMAEEQSGNIRLIEV